MLKFNVQFKDGTYRLLCGLGSTSLYKYCQIMQVDEAQAKEDILSKGVFYASDHDIFDDNPKGLEELANILNEVNDKRVLEIEEKIKNEIEDDRKFAWALFVSSCGADMRSWSLKAMQHLNKDEFNWMEGYPSAPFDRFVTQTIQLFKPELYRFINASAISSATITEFVKKHLH